MRLVKKSNSVLVGNDFTLEQIEEVAKEWQERLYLQEWKIDYRYERRSESFLNVSESRYTPTVKKASLVFVDPVDYELASDYQSADERDMEVEIVHELLHLKLYRLRPEDNSREMDDFEQAVETMARILVQMKRG